MRLHTSEPARHAGVLLLAGGVLLAVAAVPLLLNLGSLDDTYYAVKARALAILAPLLLAGVLAARGIPDLRRTGMLWPLLAFVAAVTVATAFSIDPAWSVTGAPRRHEGLVSLLAYALTCAGTLILVARTGPRMWHGAALACATLVAGYGVAQAFGLEWLVRDSVRVSWWRPFSTTGNPNFLGAYMVLAAPLAAAALLDARHVAVTLLAGCALTLSVLAALFTYSRAAWLGLVAAALVFAFALGGRIGYASSPRIRTRLSAALAVVVVLAAAFFIPGGPLALPRADWPAAVRARSAVEPGEPAAGFRQRSYLWRHTLALLWHRPLTGYGPETFMLVLPQQWDAEKADLFGERPLRIDKAHNETLDMAMSSGLLGVAAFAWVLAAIARRVRATIAAGGTEHAVAAACLAAMVGYWIDVQWHFSAVSVAPVFWSVMGAAAGTALRTEQLR